MTKSVLNIIVIGLLTFTACNNNLNTTKVKKEKEETDPVMPGSDRDAHGCIGSAGYVWSEIMQECLRVWELPLKLTSISGEQLAGLVFSKDKSKAEIIMGEGGYILSKKSDKSYTLESAEKSLFLENKDGKWQLSDKQGGEVSYREED